MKNIFSSLLIIVLIILVGCNQEYILEDRELSVEQLPGYVAFNADGANINLSNEVTDEEGGEVIFNIEIPTGNLSNITVNYSFSGTANFGTDFSVDGATTNGGQITIEHKQSRDPEDAEADNVDLVINILTDGFADGDKKLIITLQNAVNDEGIEIPVGRGGTLLLREAILEISDVD
jgi:hypothetical protein